MVASLIRLSAPTTVELPTRAFPGLTTKSYAAGPLTTSKTGGSAHGLPALSDTATSGVLQTESGAQSSHQTVPFFQKETRTTKQKQPKIQTHTRETFST